MAFPLCVVLLLFCVAFSGVVCYIVRVFFPGLCMPKKEKKSASVRAAAAAPAAADIIPKIRAKSPAPAEIKSAADFDKLVKSLNPRHKKFADLYQISLNAKESYKKVYQNENEKSCEVLGCKLLSNIKVQKYLAWCYAQTSNELKITKNSVISSVLDVFNKSMQAVPVLDRQGNETGAFTFQALPAVKSQELLAKLLGFLSAGSVGSAGGFGEGLVLVRSYVVPAFKNVLAAPSSSEGDIKKLIEEIIKERQNRVSK